MKITDIKFDPLTGEITYYFENGTQVPVTTPYNGDFTYSEGAIYGTLAMVVLYQDKELRDLRARLEALEADERA